MGRINRHRRRRVDAEILAPDGNQLVKVAALELLLLAQDARNQRDLREVLDRLHLHESMLKVFAVRHHTMVGHENGIVLGNEWRQ